ncbi:hypothetical protein LXL04_024376 [Taraxacum kok-saghyz]
MAVHGTYSTLRSIYRRHHHHRYQPFLSSHTYQNITGFQFYFRYNRPLSTSAESVEPPELSGRNAYDLLGVAESCSFAEIKSSFRKLAKETHPDLSQSPDGISNPHRFVQILAAYEILSDTQKRVHYDSYLQSKKVFIRKPSTQGSAMYTYESYEATEHQMEVVEWLKWYRSAINDIVSQKTLANGTSYFDLLENDFYSAIHTAYHGPVINSMDFLPDCFEADERSVPETLEVLHLVSGRHLFGKVCISKRVPELQSHLSSNHTQINPHQIPSSCDAYKDLELHVSGKIVAVANRNPQDHIHVYLNLHEVDDEKDVMFLGKIVGLESSDEEGCCYFYNNCGMKTHMIMKHRTLMVKHMQWFQMGDNNVSVCECRCTRARLPPSKYWLFQPRDGLHDIGGWYVETYGRDIKGKNVPSQRYWDGVDFSQPCERRVHPAVYLLAIAYRTLDIEESKRRKQTFRDIFHGKLSEIYNWCKRLV